MSLPGEARRQTAAGGDALHNDRVEATLWGVGVGRHPSPGRHGSPHRVILSSVPERKPKVSDERITQRMGARRLRRWANDNFIESVIAFAPVEEEDADTQASELPFFQRGCRFSVSGLGEARADAATHTPPRAARPAKPRAQQPSCPAGRRLMQLSTSERALLREWAAQPDSEEWEGLLACEAVVRSYLCACAERLSPPVRKAAVGVAASEVSSESGEGVLVCLADAEPDASSAAGHPSAVSDCPDGWEMVSEPAPRPTVSSTDVASPAAMAAQTSAPAHLVSAPRRVPTRRHGHASAKRRQHRALSSSSSSSSAAASAATALPPCVLPPTCNPIIRSLHRACAAFYGLRGVGVVRPRGAMHTDEAALQVQIAAHTMHTMPTLPTDEAALQVQIAAHTDATALGGGGGGSGGGSGGSGGGGLGAHTTLAHAAVLQRSLLASAGLSISLSVHPAFSSRPAAHAAHAAVAAAAAASTARSVVVEGAEGRASASSRRRLDL